MTKFIVHAWRTMTIGPRWRTHNSGEQMVRYVNGRIEYRPMTAEEYEDAAWWQAMK